MSHTSIEFPSLISRLSRRLHAARSHVLTLTKTSDVIAKSLKVPGRAGVSEVGCLEMHVGKLAATIFCTRLAKQDPHAQLAFPSLEQVSSDHLYYCSGERISGKQLIVESRTTPTVLIFVLVLDTCFRRQDKDTRLDADPLAGKRVTSRTGSLALLWPGRFLHDKQRVRV